jgi:hypothetical protein
MINIPSLRVPILTNGTYLEAQVTVRKQPISIALSNRILEKIDKEASKQKRSRSEFVELHFEAIFFAQRELENKLT